MSEDDVWSAVAGFSQGLSSALVPIMKMKYASRLEAERDAKLNQYEVQKEERANQYGVQKEGRALTSAKELEQWKQTIEPTVPLYNTRTKTVIQPPPGSKRMTPFDDTPKDKGLGKPSVGQTAVDRAFGKDYAEYVAGGGYGDLVGQITGLEGVLGDLKKGKSNLSGPGMSMLPDSIRKRTFTDSMTAQQTVEDSVMRSLRKTLGAQFTENEGRLFMQRGYDPALPEKENAKKLERAIGKLKTMALAKQDAVDFFEENGTLSGFKGKLYTIKDGEMAETTKDDFYKMMRTSSDKSGGAGIEVGSEDGGYVFMGGNPADKGNWKKK